MATRTTVKPDARIFATSISEVYQEAIDAFRTDYSVESIAKLMDNQRVSAPGQEKQLVLSGANMETYRLRRSYFESATALKSYPETTSLHKK